MKFEITPERIGFLIGYAHGWGYAGKERKETLAESLELLKKDLERRGCVLL